MSQIAAGAGAGAAFGPIGLAVGATGGAILSAFSAMSTNRAVSQQARRVRDAAGAARQGAMDNYQLERLAARQRGAIMRGSIRASAAERGFTGGSIDDLLTAQIVSEAIDNQTRATNAANRQRELMANFEAQLGGVLNQSVNGIVATAQGAISGGMAGYQLGAGIDAMRESNRLAAEAANVNARITDGTQTFRLGGEEIYR